jgi:hypothetical protein
VEEGVGRVARHDDEVGAHAAQHPCAVDEPGGRVLAVVEQRLGPVRHTRIGVDDDRDMLLIVRCRRDLDDLLVEVGRRERSHPAEDTDDGAAIDRLVVVGGRHRLQVGLDAGL